MKFTRLAALALALLIGGSLGIAAADQGVVETTSAAWTDRTQIAATATAGTWQTVTPNTCIAYGFSGEKLAGCRVTSITFEGWGEPGKQTRNYYINFNVDPLVVRRISFDVDLSTATGQGTTWSWKTARVRSDGGQFTPISGWKCADLPRVRGNGADWERQRIWLAVEEFNSGAPTICN